MQRHREEYTWLTGRGPHPGRTVGSTSARSGLSAHHRLGAWLLAVALACLASCFSGCAVAVVWRAPGQDPALTRVEWMVAGQVLVDDELSFELEPPESGGGVRWQRKTDGQDTRDRLLEYLVAGGGVGGVAARDAARAAE